MSRPKARFNGSQKSGRVKELTDNELQRLRDLWPHGGIASEVWGHPSDQFAESLTAVVQEVRAQRLQDRAAVTKEDACAELRKVAQQLREAEQMLRTLSPDVDVLLGVEADPFGCADTINVLLSRFQHAEDACVKMYSMLSSAERDKRLALDICVQVAEVLKDHGINVAATAVVDFAQQSQAVTACVVVGELSGICRSPATWRDLLAEVLNAWQ